MTHVDMLKSGALNKPAVTKPNTAEPVRAPTRLRMRNVIKTMRANVTLEHLSFGFGGCGSWINGTADSDIGATIWGEVMEGKRSSKKHTIQKSAI